MLSHSIRLMLPLTLSAIVLSGCGGGSSGKDSNPSPTPDNGSSVETDKDTVGFDKSVHSYANYLPRIHKPLALKDYPGDIETRSVKIYPDGRISFSAVFGSDDKRVSKLLSADGQTLSAGFKYNSSGNKRLHQSPALLHLFRRADNAYGLYLHKAGETDEGTNITGDVLTDYLYNGNYWLSKDDTRLLFRFNDSLYSASLVNPGEPTLLQANIQRLDGRVDETVSDGDYAYFGITLKDNSSALYRYQISTNQLEKIVDSYAEDLQLINDGKYLLYKTSSSTGLQLFDITQNSIIDLTKDIIEARVTELNYDLTALYSKATNSFIATVTGTSSSDGGREKKLVNLSLTAADNADVYTKNPLITFEKTYSRISQLEMSPAGDKFFIRYRKDDNDIVEFFNYDTVQKKWLKYNPGVNQIAGRSYGYRWLDHGKRLLKTESYPDQGKILVSNTLLTLADGTTEELTQNFPEFQYFQKSNTLFYMAKNQADMFDFYQYDFNKNQRTKILTTNSSRNAIVLHEDDANIWLSAALNGATRLLRYQPGSAQLTNIASEQAQFISEDVDASRYSSHSPALTSPDGQAMAFLTRASGAKAGALILNNLNNKTSCRIEFEENGELSIRNRQAVFSADNQYFYYKVDDFSQAQEGNQDSVKSNLYQARVADCKLVRLDKKISRTIDKIWVTPDSKKLVISTRKAGVLMMSIDNSEVTDIYDDATDVDPDLLEDIEFAANNKKIIFWSERRKDNKQEYSLIMASLTDGTVQRLDSDTNPIKDNTFGKTYTLSPDRNFLIYETKDRAFIHVDLMADKPVTQKASDKLKSLYGTQLDNENGVIGRSGSVFYYYDFTSNQYTEISSFIAEGETYDRLLKENKTKGNLLTTYSKGEGIIRTYHFYRLNTQQIVSGNSEQAKRKVAEVTFDSGHRPSFLNLSEQRLLYLAYKKQESCTSAIATLYQLKLDNTPATEIEEIGCRKKLITSDTGAIVFEKEKDNRTEINLIKAGSQSATPLVALDSEVNIEKMFILPTQHSLYLAMDKEQPGVIELYQYPLQ